MRVCTNTAWFYADILMVKLDKQACIFVHLESGKEWPEMRNYGVIIHILYWFKNRHTWVRDNIQGGGDTYILLGDQVIHDLFIALV